MWPPLRFEDPRAWRDCGEVFGVESGLSLGGGELRDRLIYPCTGWAIHSGYGLLGRVRVSSLRTCTSVPSTRAYGLTSCAWQSAPCRFVVSCRGEDQREVI